MFCLYVIVILSYFWFHWIGGNADFNSAPQTATITAGTNRSTINIRVTNDNIVEGNEVFTMNFNVPPSLGPGVINGGITMATGVIIDTTSKFITRYCIRTNFRGM